MVDPYQESLDDPNMAFEDRWALIQELDSTNRRLGIYTRFVAEFDRWLDSLETEKGTPLSVLDVGSGSGGLCRSLYEYSRSKGREFDFHLYDSQADVLEESRKLFSPRARVTTHVAPESHLQAYRDQSFDVVISLQVVHHIQPLSAAVSALEQMLRVAGKGVFIVDLYNKPLAITGTKVLSHLLGYSKGLASDGVKSLMRAHSPDELMKELQKTPCAQAQELSLHKYKIYPFWRLESRRTRPSTADL